jgi:hypothetical protein
MAWTTLFTLTNVVAAIGWLVLLLAPRRPVAHSFVLFGAVGLLCLTYLVLFVALVGGLVDPGAVPGVTAAPFDYSDYSIGGIRRLFGTDAGIVVGWTHYLAFDLFVGLWIARDADAKGFGRLFQAPFLLLTYLAGPIGLFLWLLMRERRARASARR